jgi:hypothetical protein
VITPNELPKLFDISGQFGRNSSYHKELRVVLKTPATEVK